MAAAAFLRGRGANGWGRVRRSRANTREKPFVALSRAPAPPTRGRCSRPSSSPPVLHHRRGHPGRGGAGVFPLFSKHNKLWASTPSSSSATPPSPAWRAAASWRTMGGRRTSCAVRDVFFFGEDGGRCAQKKRGVTFLLPACVWQILAPTQWLCVCVRSHRVCTQGGAVVGAVCDLDGGGHAFFLNLFFTHPTPHPPIHPSQNPGLLR